MAILFGQARKKTGRSFDCRQLDTAERPSAKTMYVSCAVYKKSNSLEPKNSSFWSLFHVPMQTEYTTTLHTTRVNAQLMRKKLPIFFPLITKVERHFCCRLKILFYISCGEHIFEVCTSFRLFAFFASDSHSFLFISFRQLSLFFPSLVTIIARFLNFFFSFIRC